MFHDELTPINVSGLVVTIGSIAAYNYIKITKMRQDSREKLKEETVGEVEEEPMLDDEGGGEEGEGGTARRRHSTTGLVKGGAERSSVAFGTGSFAVGEEDTDERARDSSGKRREDVE